MAFSVAFQSYISESFILKTIFSYSIAEWQKLESHTLKGKTKATQQPKPHQLGILYSAKLAFRNGEVRHFQTNTENIYHYHISLTNKTKTPKQIFKGSSPN